MPEWKGIQINTNSIEARTDKAVLFNCPHKSSYDGYSFWHPAKLVLGGSHSAAVNVRYTEDFEFTLRRHGKNKNILAEKKISAREFESIFKTVNENISAPRQKDEYEVHVPQEITGMAEATVDESLRR